jgi:hypothetical protein
VRHDVNVVPSVVASTSVSSEPVAYPPTTYAVVPSDATTWSDRGVGRCPTRAPAPPATGTDCTQSADAWTPPPSTNAEPPRTAPPASCVAWASRPAAVIFTAWGSSLSTWALVLPATSPPSRSTWPSAATATTREAGAGSRTDSVVAVTLVT